MSIKITNYDFKWSYRSINKSILSRESEKYLTTVLFAGITLLSRYIYCFSLSTYAFIYINIYKYILLYIIIHTNYFLFLNL